MSATTAGAPRIHEAAHRWKLLGLLGTAQLMLILDITVVAVALPSLGDDLEMGRQALTWVMTGYTLAFGGLMLCGGRAADVWGPRPLVITGLAIFTLASLTVGLASTGEMAIAGRVVQGVGAALLSPAALSIVVRLFEGEERAKALGIWSALGGAGAALGVLLGGIITAGPGWEWVFFVNVPVGLGVAIALLRLLPPMPSYGGGRLDTVGAVLVTAATVMLTWAFTGAGETGWTSVSTLTRTVAALVLYLAFAAWLRRTSHPLVSPGLLARRPVIAGSVVLLVTTGLMVAVFFLGTFHLQQNEGHGPLATGLLFLPVALATMTGAQFGGRLISRTGARSLGAAGLLTAGAGLAVPGLAGLGTITTVSATSIGALGLGALFVVTAATTLSQVAPEEAGIASGVLNTSHELGSALGAAVMSGVAAASVITGSHAGFERGYLVAGVVAVAGAAMTALLIKRT